MSKGRKAIKTENGIIYQDTGEHIEGEYGRFKTEEQIAKDREYFKKQNEMALIKKEKNENYLKIDEPFIWQYFTEQEKLFPNLKPQDITRLIYIATYCEYETNKLIENKTYITKKRMFELIGISQTQFKEWFNKMIDNQYLKVTNDHIILNKKFFNKGNILKKDNATRLFINVVQNLYKNINSKNHHKVGYIFKLIPYLNPYLNVLAKNPQETNRDCIEKFRMSDLAEIMGVSSKDIRKLANELLSITYGENDTPLIGLVAFKSLDVKNMLIIMNTKLVFGGNLEQYKEIEQLFDDRILENKNDKIGDK